MISWSPVLETSIDQEVDPRIYFFQIPTKPRLLLDIDAVQEYWFLSELNSMTITVDFGLQMMDEEKKSGDVNLFDSFRTFNWIHIHKWASSSN